MMPWLPCITRARFLSLARSKLRLCSANHRAGYFSNLHCDWLSIVWAYSSKRVTENGPRSSKDMIATKLSGHFITFMWWIPSAYLISMVSCQKGSTRHAYAWQIGPFWQDTLDTRTKERHPMWGLWLAYLVARLPVGPNSPAQPAPPGPPLVAAPHQDARGHPCWDGSPADSECPGGSLCPQWGQET